MNSSLLAPAAPREQAAPFDLFQLPTAYYEDPYPYFRALRDETPVHANSDGSVLVTRYADVKAVWRDLSGVKAYLLEHINAWRARPVEETPSNVISALVKAEKSGQSISENEMVHMCILLLNGGHETTTNLIGLSTLALLRNRDQFERMAGDEVIVGTGIEECLRYTSPLQLQGRRTTREIELPSGARIAAGVEVVIAQASANRDERVFTEPERFDLGRRPNPHLAFGAGIHVCLGRPLARLEAAIALPAITRRFPKMDLRAGLAFNPNARFRGIRRMPVALS